MSHLGKLVTIVAFILTYFAGSYVVAEEAQKEQLKTPLLIRELPEFRITKGKVLYTRYCSFCHGDAGGGDGLNSYSMPVKPRSFNNQDMMTQKTAEELEKVILSGGASQRLSGYMPAFSNTLSNLEAGHLVKYIREKLSGK
jgi:mono/diheme cytochrome c family protein